MSTIFPKLGSSSTGMPSVPSTSTPEQPGLMREDLSALLKSPPQWSTSPKQPEPAPKTSAQSVAISPETGNAASELETLLSEDSIEKMLREPRSDETRILLYRLKQLVNQTHLPTPHSPAHTATPNPLSHDKIGAVLKKVINEVGEMHLKKIKEESPYQAARAYDNEGVEDIIGYVNDAEKSRDELKRTFSEIEATAKALEDIGTLLNAKQRSAPATATTPDNADAKTYRYGSLSDSPLNSPSEIRAFNNNDTIDLTSLQKQLNKPLRLVENFSGASGEMQIHYLPSTRTSVLIVANDSGQPPMVIKVFGELRHQNLAL